MIYLKKILLKYYKMINKKYNNLENLPFLINSEILKDKHYEYPLKLSKYINLSIIMIKQVFLNFIIM